MFDRETGMVVLFKMNNEFDLGLMTLWARELAEDLERLDKATDLQDNIDHLENVLLDVKYLKEYSEGLEKWVDIMEDERER